MPEERTTVVSATSEEINQLEDDLTMLKKEEAELSTNLKRNKKLQKLIEEEREEIKTGREPKKVALDNLMEACKDELQRKDLTQRIKECRDLYIDNDLISAVLFIFNVSVPNINIYTIPNLDINNEEDKALIGELILFINKEMENAIAITDSKAPFLIKLRIKAIERILKPFEQIRKKYESVKEKEERMLLDYYSAAKKKAA